MRKELLEMREMELKLLIIEYNKASQLDRSFSKTKLTDQKKKLFKGFYMKTRNIFAILLFFLIIGKAYTNDFFDNITSLAERYEIKPSLAISIIKESSLDMFSESSAASWFSFSHYLGLPGVLWDDLSLVTRTEAYSEEYILYWTVRYICYLHHPDFKFNQWQIAAAFYDGENKVLRGNISPTGRAFADRVINNISLYSSYDK
jgi:hypothetical protein